MKKTLFFYISLFFMVILEASCLLFNVNEITEWIVGIICFLICTYDVVKIFKK